MTRQDWITVSELHAVLRITPMLGLIISAVFVLVFGRNEYWETVCLTSMAIALPVLFITAFTEIAIDQKIEDAEAAEK